MVIPIKKTSFTFYSIYVTLENDITTTTNKKNLSGIQDDFL